MTNGQSIMCTIKIQTKNLQNKITGNAGKKKKNKGGYKHKHVHDVFYMFM